MKQAFLEDTPHIRWSLLTPKDVPAAVEEAMTNASKQLEAIASLSLDELTFANTFMALESAADDLDRAWGRVGHLDSVCNSDALRDVHNEWLPKVSAFYAQIALNDDLWRVLKSASESAEITSGLTEIEKRLMDETLRDFRRNGADLPPTAKKRFEEIKRTLAEKTQKFSENVLDATNAWDLVIEDESCLSGLPDSAKDAARAAAKEKGHGSDDAPQWRFTLQAPSVIPVLQYADEESLRREVWEAYSQIGRQAPHENLELISEILALRHEQAELLGEASFADHVLAPRMAKDGKTALGFIEDLHDRIGSQFAQELQELETFKAEETGSSTGPLEPWELGYWGEKLRQKRYDFDEEVLRPYFAIDRVIEGMFDITQETLGIRLQERETVFHEEPNETSSAGGPVEVWHPEVKFYDVFDQSGEFLGGFYADWHPRESKRGGAWMNYLRTGLPPSAAPDGKREPHIGLICGNLTPSVEDKPALLTHREVETIFHEFGHLLHHLLGDVAIKSLNGVNVVWDFVELPSQLMENFCWERVSLDRFARHVETGEPIPDDLFERMLAARHFQAAMATMRQLSFGKMDLELHYHYPGFKGKSIDREIDAMLATYQATTKSPRPNNAPAFTHLFASSTGYAAGYYSYKWAEVLDADAFTRFQAAGVISAAVGREYREKILSRGNSRDAGELFRDFMGRDPDLNALLVRSGLS